jgi:hypothetical protein
MNTKELQLWNAVQAFELDDDEHPLMFSDRLAKENGWSKEFALKAIEEYKKFMFLICVTNHPLTPSDEVDQVWHLHLLYTRSYWRDFCTEVLKREVHHGPTKGGPEEDDKFHDWYGKTLVAYQERFNHEPPRDIWPPPKERLRHTRHRWLDLARYWVIPKTIL